MGNLYPATYRGSNLGHCDGRPKCIDPIFKVTYALIMSKKVQLVCTLSCESMDGFRPNIRKAESISAIRKPEYRNHRMQRIWVMIMHSKPKFYGRQYAQLLR